MYKMLFYVVIGLCLAGGAYGASMTIVDLPATGTDAAIGISADKTYTHTIDFGSNAPVTINGVAFVQGLTETMNDPFVSVSSQGYGYIVDDTRAEGKKFRPHSGNDDVSSVADGDSAEMLRDMIYYSNNAPADEGIIITLQDLAPGTEYSVRYYFRKWDDNGVERPLTVVAAGVEPTTIDIDGPGAHYLDYTFVADGNDVTITFITGITGEGPHIYGLTCEEIPVALPIAAMIVNPDDLSSGFDQAQHDRLVSMGYEVTVVPQGDVGSAFMIDDANTYDLLLISESISSSAADPLRGTTTPVMHNEGYGWDNWYLTTGASPGWQSGSDVDIVNDTHPIAVDAGVGAGPLAFYSTSDAWTTDLVSALAPGAKLIAQITVDSADYAIIFTIDVGAELTDGNPAPARIAAFSITGSTTYDANGMTDEAWALWDATIHWLNPAPPLLINGSFELPGTDKIHSFNGENPSDGAYGEYEDNPLPAGPDTDVPGWQTDGESVDSGIQLGSDFNGSTDGDWVAFMRSSNPALWQLTDHVIEANDVIVFSVDASLNWNGKTLQMTIYYDDDGTRVPIASADYEMQDDWQTFTVTSDVSAVLEAIGKKLGVEINHSGVADPTYDGWMMFDNAVLEVN